MNDCTVSILGAEWKIYFRTRKEDKLLKTFSGYCDYTTREIVVYRFPRPTKREQVNNPDIHEKGALRHEIVHAFLYESGLANDSCTVKAWSMNEEMIDWIAFQHEKMHKAFEEAGAL